MRIHPGSRFGFTLVEIMIVVVIIGLLATMALPAINRVRRQSQATTIANDMRTFRDAIETYVLENGTFPEFTAAGFPPIYTDWISEEKWNEGSALKSGVWQYYYTGAPAIPELVLDTPGEDNSDIFEIVDDILDDGDAGTGRVVRGAVWVGWVFEQ